MQAHCRSRRSTKAPTCTACLPDIYDHSLAVGPEESDLASVSPSAAAPVVLTPIAAQTNRTGVAGGAKRRSGQTRSRVA